MIKINIHGLLKNFQNKNIPMREIQIVVIQKIGLIYGLEEKPKMESGDGHQDKNGLMG